MIRILHTGDWHIGRFSGPEKNGTNARYLDICKCLDTLINKAAELSPDYIIVAGDIFHAARTWSDRGLTEVETAIRAIRLLSNVAPVVVMRGTPNHDGDAHFKMLCTAFDDDDSVTIVTEPEVHQIASYRGDRLNVACLPGFDRGYFRAKNPGLSSEEENLVFTQALADIIAGLRAQCEPGIKSVLVGHYTITGANMESGQTQLFSQYEPVVEPATLAAADFDLVCFGHIHRPQQLDGCKSTFYCGAVTQLTFGDEGQERGFYVHKLGGDKPQREFYRLPTREFLTVRLRDEEIAAINDGTDELSWMSDVKDKIVRVLYDCTDEHNKALNKTMLERRIYEQGAFWVQEITPQKITVTVSKEAMTDDDSPEANLRTYLMEHEVTEADAGRVVERARPIIAEATEAHMTEHKSGSFVPVEIEVHNYRNYRDEAFNFEDIQFCTINGENGAGKSSLFMDAMCDALFEETREGDITGWICNDPEARSGSIKFTFRLGEATYRVIRTRMKSGKATLNLAELVDGEWVNRSREKFKDTQTEILNAIGMDSLTLKATALIMQDQYGLFLTADKEARMTILGNILGLGAYGDMEDLAAARLTDVNRAIRTAKDKAADIAAATPDEAELEAKIEKKQAEAETLSKELSAAQRKADNMKLTLAMMDEAAQQAIKLNNRFSGLSAKKAAAEASITAQKGIVFQADAILAEREAIEAGLTEYRGMLEREKELLSAKTEYDALSRQIDSNKVTRTTMQMQADKLKEKRAAMVLTKLTPAQQLLNQAPELEAEHENYETAKAALDELTAIAPAYETAQVEVKRWTDEQIRLDSDYKQARTRYEDRITVLKSKVEILENSGCPDTENATCRFLADAQRAREKLPGVEKAIAALDKEYESGRRTISEALEAARASAPENYTPESERAARALLSGLESSEKRYRELAVAKAELEAVQERIADLDRQMEEKAAHITELTEAIERQETQRTGMTADIAAYTQVKARITELAEYVEKEKRLPVAEERKATAQARITEMGESVAELNQEIIETGEELEAARKKTDGIEDLRSSYTAAAQTVEDYGERIQEANMSIGALREASEKAQQQRAQVAELMEQVESMSVEAADLDTLKQAFSQDGIPHNIVRSIIPIFEATATNILGQMSGGHMSVEFVMEKTLKSNSKKEVTTLDVVINDSVTGRLPYMSRSGGEKVKASLSVILALSEIKQTKAGVQVGFLAIDEPSFLDAKGTQAYCDALEAIQSRYPDVKVMAITHDESFKARFPQSVTVYKDETGSHVRMD